MSPHTFGWILAVVIVLGVLGLIAWAFGWEEVVLLLSATAAVTALVLTSVYLAFAISTNDWSQGWHEMWQKGNR